uniref:WW domain-containing protein n=1 Tax=Globisporangium ultimum (strain ATCC 200006 / CBS 805.95 / DAOM BR144) TaxID=431595 RepID=K3X3M5_GLOUD
MATDTAKSGIWTEHVDANGRKFYFNMVHGRSYWELPDELLVQVKRPAIDELRDWDPSFRHERDSEEARRRREEVLLHAAANARATNVAPGMVALQERMAQAAQRKKKETELKQQRATEEKQKSEDATNEYLKMHTDKDTDTTGGKWLVR